ncbi:phosphotransferase [Stigmatella sp. ncwal1]|uniref:Phosphotransferase n=1 Tax=Stigmatella ashevillensis TaxID=2995309 RepID=A0ABT5DLF3_9BACT|nr:phosphotransferase [Stigmatella ashevillena]MDC0713192.1 phosphotransferase [Stigmatella ashevillena]
MTGLVVSRTQLEACRSRLVQSFQGQRWLSEPSGREEGFDIEDFVQLPGEASPFVLTLLRFHGSGHQYFVPLRVTVTGERETLLSDASYDAGFITALLQCMREQRTLTTEKQRALHCRAQTPRTERFPLQVAPFKVDMSSNCLSELRHGEDRWICKLYKRLSTEGGNELRALQILAGSGLAPELMGSITYEDGTGLQALGAMTARVEGEPIYLPLSRHIKALIAQVVATPREVSTLTRNALADLEPLCRRLGEQLLLFHQRLNQRLTTAPGEPAHFQLAPYLDTHRARWTRLHASVKRDDSLPSPLRAEALRQLQRISHVLLAPERLRHVPPLPATIAHGDLHLSHILVASDDDGTPQLSILDVSPRSLDAQAPAFLTQTVLQDLLSLLRAIQYFAFDEILDGIKDVLGITQFEATQLVLEAPGRLPLSCQAQLTLLSDWSKGLFGCIERAYLRAFERGTALDIHPSYARLFYVCRLLQELEYNYSYHRDFFKYCDFYYLLHLEGLE